MRLFFLGSGAFGLPTFQMLAQSHEVLGVLTGEDRPAGRRRKMHPMPIATWAQEQGITLFKSSNVNTPQMTEIIDDLIIDAMVVIAFGQKLLPQVLGDRVAINLHASLLPRWRGASPINATILHGDTVAGVSVITIEDRMDSGVVLGQQSTPVDPSETAGELHDRLALLGPDLVLKVLAGDGSGITQDESQVTYAPKLSRADAKLDLSYDAQTIARTIRGLSPWPGCHLTIAGIDCKLLRAIPKNGTGNCGEILVDGTIAVGDGSIEIMELQPAGGKLMSWKDFCNGRSVNTGDICEVRS